MTNKKWLLVPLILLLTAGVAGAWVYSAKSDSAEADGDIVANESVAPEVAQLETMPAPDGPTSTPVTTPAVSLKDIHITVDGSSPNGPKSIGKIDAPVTMTEYSSLTCPHCAHAHELVLPGLIKDYVETGKLRIVFSDFPLNKEALDASKVSRCVANDQYFGFLTLLFSDIEKWAYSGQHPEALITNATLTGLPADRARACLNDTSLEESLMKAVQDASAKYKINSTPTFVFNDGKKILMGARPYSEFKNTIDGLLAESK